MVGANRSRVFGLMLAGLWVFAPAARGQEITSAALHDWLFYNDAGWFFLNRKNYAAAEDRFRRAILAVKPYEATRRVLLARSYADLARALYHQRRYAEAEPLARWSLEVRQAQKGVPPEVVFQGEFLMAQILRGQKRYAEAEPLLKDALTLQEKSIGPHHENVALTAETLAEVYRDQGKNPEAELYYKRAVAVSEASAPDPDRSLAVAEVSEHYAAFLRRLNRTSDADGLETRARAIRDTVETEAARARAARAGAQFKGFR
jgi:tetratricopeptide (TPR) repeat protein